jgi:hypothetical protein
MGKWRLFGLAHLDAKLTPHLGGATTTFGFLNFNFLYYQAQSL